MVESELLFGGRKLHMSRDAHECSLRSSSAETLNVPKKLKCVGYENSVKLTFYSGSCFLQLNGDTSLTQDLVFDSLCLKANIKLCSYRYYFFFINKQTHI